MKALDKFKEEDFEFFREGVSSGRLNPVSMGGGLFVFPLISSLGVYGSMALTFSGTLVKTWSVFVTFQIFSVILLFILSLLFFSKWLSLKFQKFQMVVLILNVIKMVFDLTFACLGALKQQVTALPFNWIVILYILGSILLFLLSTFRGYHLLQTGQFRENGHGLLGGQYSEKISKFSNIFGFALGASFIGALGAAFFGETGFTFVVVFAMLGLSAIIYSVGVTEFIFVLYCKIRFPSFNITAEQQVDVDKEGKLLIEQMNRLEKKEKEAIKQRKREKRENLRNHRQ